MAQLTLVMGAPGTGKCITLLRLAPTLLAAALADCERARIIDDDAMGLGRSKREDFVTIVERHGLTVHHCPQLPLDDMSGRHAEVWQRLNGLFDAGENSFHHAAATTMLDLAVGAGEKWSSRGRPRGADPVRRGGTRLRRTERSSLSEHAEQLMANCTSPTATRWPKRCSNWRVPQPPGRASSGPGEPGCASPQVVGGSRPVASTRTSAEHW